MALIAAHLNAGVILVGTVLSGWCFTSAKAITLIGDGRMEVGEEGEYIATLSPPE